MAIPLNHVVGYNIAAGDVTNTNDFVNVRCDNNQAKVGDALLMVASLGLGTADPDSGPYITIPSGWGKTTNWWRLAKIGSNARLVMAVGGKYATADDTGSAPTTYEVALAENLSTARQLTIVLFVYRGVRFWENSGAVSRLDGGSTTLTVSDSLLPSKRSMAAVVSVCNFTTVTFPNITSQAYARITSQAGWTYPGCYARLANFSPGVYTNHRVRNYDKAAATTSSLVLPETGGPILAKSWSFKVKPDYEDYPWVVEWPRSGNGAMTGNSFTVSPPSLCEAGDILVLQAMGAEDGNAFTMDAGWATIDSFSKSGYGDGIAAWKLADASDEAGTSSYTLTRDGTPTASNTTAWTIGVIRNAGVSVRAGAFAHGSGSPMTLPNIRILGRNAVQLGLIWQHGVISSSLKAFGSDEEAVSGVQSLIECWNPQGSPLTSMQLSAYGVVRDAGNSGTIAFNAVQIDSPTDLLGAWSVLSLVVETSAAGFALGEEVRPPGYAVTAMVEPAGTEFSPYGRGSAGRQGLFTSILSPDKKG